MPRIFEKNVARCAKQTWLCLGLAFVAAMTAAAPVQAQPSYPSRAITFVLPISPGSAMDVLARLYIDRLSRLLNVSTVVQNRPGAGGLIAAQTVATSPADGYTFLVANSGLLNLPMFHKTMPFDPVNDFVGVAMMGDAPAAITVHHSLGVKSLREFVDLAKKKPGTINYVSAGIGTATHIAGAYFERQANVRLAHVPYKDMSLATADMTSGLVQAAFTPITPQITLVQEGKLVALAAATPEPLTDPIPLPTAISQGVDYTYSTWYGIMAFKGTPPEAIEKVSNAIGVASKDPDLIAKVGAQGILANALSASEFQKHIRSEIDRYGPVLKDIQKELDAAPKSP